MLLPILTILVTMFVENLATMSIKHFNLENFIPYNKSMENRDLYLFLLINTLITCLFDAILFVLVPTKGL